MQCERLIKMIKSWYVHVREETMAPARMVSFIEQHVDTCEVCLQDPDLQDEIRKITEIVLPESKIPKAVRQQNAQKNEDEVDDADNQEDDNIEESEQTEPENDELKTI